MTGLIVLGFVPLLAAVMFWLRAVRERDARAAAEEEMRRMRAEGQGVEEARLRFLGIVAHELRSPLSAIIGYQELLADGIYGEVDAQAAEALQRIGYAARQLLTLTDGMEELSGRTAAAVAESVGGDVWPALHESLDDVARYAASRSVRLDVQLPAELGPVRGDPERAGTALDLVLQAAVKLARAGSVTVAVTQHDGRTLFTISGAGLEYARLPESASTAGTMVSDIGSGAALRLAIARRILQRMHGGLDLADAVWVLRYGQASATGAAAPRPD